MYLMVDIHPLTKLLRMSNNLITCLTEYYISASCFIEVLPLVKNIFKCLLIKIIVALLAVYLKYKNDILQNTENTVFIFINPY
jgi:hypothetical protein